MRNEESQKCAIDGDCSMNCINSAGFQCTDGLVSQAELSELRGESDRLLHGIPEAGIRSLVSRSSRMLSFAESETVRNVIESHLGTGAFLARSILFDKNPKANWDVAWHQDTAIAVVARQDAPGFGPWSVKEGVTHVRPPAAVLERMITLRVHLDDTPWENGALRVIPGSHRSGILTADEVTQLVANGQPVTCERRAGDAMLMRPLLLHSSRKANSPSRRRVIHFEFAADRLPSGLTWARC